MNPIHAIHTYFSEAIHEMRKIVWPTKKQTRVYSIIVIVMSLGMATFFGLADYVFNLILSSLLR